MSFGYQVLGFGSGGGAGAAFIVATGGTITTVCTDYKVHTFTGDGTFCVSAVGNAAGSETVDYMVVAGGAGSGDYHGAGGGAGGWRASSGTASGCYVASCTTPLTSPVSALPVSATGYPITVGAGGPAGARPGANNGGQGGNSIFSTITSTGGGGGGGSAVGAAPGNSGGSGGGGGGTAAATGGAGNTPPVSPFPAQGTAGWGPSCFSPFLTTGGGGGGATQAGNTGPPGYQTRGGNGSGSEINPSPCVGTPGPAPDSRYFAGGGGGSCGGAAGAGGHGGGGPIGTPGTANTGGGAGNENRTGGSGIVIIRYKFQ